MDKRIIFLFAAMISLFIITSPTNIAFSASKATVNVNVLNVREEPSINSKAIGQLKKGKEVTISKEKDSWTKISFGTSYGWVTSKYLSKIKAKSVNVSTKEGYVTATSLNLRKSATTTSTKLASLKKGEVVHIQKSSGSWLNIYVPSIKKTGWVTKSYISTEKTNTNTGNKSTAYYVTANSLNIRKEPTITSEKLYAVKKNDKLIVLEKKENWGKVATASGKTGWASLSYLTSKAPSNKDVSVEKSIPSNVNKGTTYYVTANSLNIRKEPAITSEKLFEVKKNEKLIVSKKEGNWGKVTTVSGKSGWASLSFLTTDISKDPSGGLKNKVIVIDAGHGGKDPGASGETYQEKTLTLAIAKELKQSLENKGTKVIMTRDGDTYPSLSDRVNISHNNDADIFISIHLNSSNSKDAHGIDTYYYATNINEQELAICIQEELIKATGLTSRGVHEGNFQVIRTNTKAALLVEFGFISNPDEEKILASKDFQVKAATGIMKGLERYFSK